MKLFVSQFISLVAKIVLFLLTANFIVGCYRMPKDGEVSVVPVTNNPSITRQPTGTLGPQISY